MVISCWFQLAVSKRPLSVIVCYSLKMFTCRHVQATAAHSDKISLLKWPSWRLSKVIAVMTTGSCCTDKLEVSILTSPINCHRHPVKSSSWRTRLVVLATQKSCNRINPERHRRDDQETHTTCIQWETKCLESMPTFTPLLCVWCGAVLRHGINIAKVFCVSISVIAP